MWYSQRDTLFKEGGAPLKKLPSIVLFFVIIKVFMTCLNCGATPVSNFNVQEGLHEKSTLSPGLSPGSRYSPLLKSTTSNQVDSTNKSMKANLVLINAKTKNKSKHNHHRPHELFRTESTNKSSTIHFASGDELQPIPPTFPKHSIKSPGFGTSSNFHNVERQQYEGEKSLFGTTKKKTRKSGTGEVSHVIPILNFHASPLISVGVENVNVEHDEDENKMENHLKYGYHFHPELSTRNEYQHSDYKPYNNNLQKNSFNIMDLKQETEYNAEAERIKPFSPSKIKVNDHGAREKEYAKLISIKNPNQESNSSDTRKMNHVGVGGNDRSNAFKNFPQSTKAKRGNRHPKIANYQSWSWKAPSLSSDVFFATTSDKSSAEPKFLNQSHKVNYYAYAGNKRRQHDSIALVQEKTSTDNGLDKMSHVYYYHPPPEQRQPNFQTLEPDSDSHAKNPSSDIAGLVIVQMHSQPKPLSSLPLSPEMHKPQTEAFPQITQTETEANNILHYKPIDYHNHLGDNNHASNYKNQNYNNFSYFHNHGHHGSASDIEDSYRSHSAPTHSPTHTHSEDTKDMEFDEGRITIANVMLGSKYLKKGTAFVILAAIIVTLVIAGVATAGGLSLSPIIFPLFLLPIAIIAFLLFIPSIILFVPIVIAGLAGGQERRRMDQFSPILGHGIWDRFFSSDGISRNLDSILANISNSR